MMRRTACLLFVVGCHSSTAPTPTVALSAATPAVSVVPAPSLPDVIVTQWNDANVKHDSAALEALYAREVVFYGVKMTNAEGAKKKAAAFERSPSYTQTLDRPTFEESDEPGVVWARYEPTHP